MKKYFLCAALLGFIGVSLNTVVWASEAQYQDCLSIKEYFNDPTITCDEHNPDKKKAPRKRKETNRIAVEQSTPDAVRGEGIYFETESRWYR